MPAPREPTIVAADHPSIDGALARFLTDLRSDPGSLGPSGSTHPEPHRSLVDALAPADGGSRLAAVVDGRIIALAGVDRHGDIRVAVAADHRGRGVGAELVRHVVERARMRGTSRPCGRSTRRPETPGNVAN